MSWGSNSTNSPSGEQHVVALAAGSRRQEIKLPAGVYQTKVLSKGAPVGEPRLVLAHPPFAAVHL